MPVLHAVDPGSSPGGSNSVSSELLVVSEGLFNLSLLSNKEVGAEGVNVGGSKTFLMF